MTHILVLKKKEVNDKEPQSRVGNNVRVSKYKNIFVRGYTSNWSEDVFIVSKSENAVPWAYVVNDLNGEEIIGKVCEKELEKTNQKEKAISHMSNAKVMTNSLIAGLTKKI